MTNKNNVFDAIVIGSGISGGWAAKELCEKGLKTLVLERGPNVEHLKDYPTAAMVPWEFKYRGRMSREFYEKNPLITKAAGFGDDTDHFLSRMPIIPMCRKNFSIGSGAIRWADGPLPGGGPAKDGVTMSSRRPIDMATDRNGPLATAKWPLGTRMRNSWGSAETRTASMQCPTGNSFLLSISTAWRNICAIP